MHAQDEQNMLPEAFASIKEAAEFWDEHDLGDYWDETSQATFDVNLERRVILVPLEQTIARGLAKVARQQGISAETLVNVWLNERLQKAV